MHIHKYIYIYTHTHTNIYVHACITCVLKQGGWREREREKGKGGDSGDEHQQIHACSNFSASLASPASSTSSTFHGGPHRRQRPVT